MLCCCCVVVVLLCCVVVLCCCFVVLLCCVVLCCVVVWCGVLWCGVVCCCVVVLCCCAQPPNDPKTLLGRVGRPFGAPLVLGLALLWLWLLWLLLVWTSLDHLPPDPPSTGNLGQNFALFLPFPATISLFLCLSGCLLVEFWWCFEGRNPEMCTFGLSGCRNPGGPTRPGCWGLAKVGQHSIGQSRFGQSRSQPVHGPQLILPQEVGWGAVEHSDNGNMHGPPFRNPIFSGFPPPRGNLSTTFEVRTKTTSMCISTVPVRTTATCMAHPSGTPFFQGFHHLAEICQQHSKCEQKQLPCAFPLFR